MFTYPAGISQQEKDWAVDFQRNFLARSAENAVEVVTLHGATTQPKEDGSIFVVGEPYDPFSNAAQATAHFVANRNELVDAETIAQSSFGSNYTLCGACWNALLYFGLDIEPIDERAKKPAAVIHHQDIESLLASDKAGCEVCSDLISRLGSFIKPHREENFGRLRLEIVWKGRDNEESNGNLRFTVTRAKQPRTMYNYGNYYRMLAYPKRQYASSFEFPKTKATALGKFTNSDMSRELACHWLRKCKQNEDGTHQDCQSRSSVWLPTRLLNVREAAETGSLRIVLRDQVPAGDAYIALSYVWGPNGHQQLPLLKSSNMLERQTRGISTAELPKTFREAVEIARWFGVSWLWVDSLCVLQDSITDWEHEAEAMSQTYRNALMTISAAANPDALGGCFVERDTRSMTSWQVTHGDQGWYIVPHYSEDQGRTRSIYTNRRAWIYRERQLSRRILHFTHEELIWECCSTGFASEVFPGGAPFPPDVAPFGGEGKYQWLLRDQVSGGSETDQDVIHDTWNALCNSFSVRQLSNPSDMPIIIATLASEFSARIPNDSYYAGLWYSTLPASLLWRTLVVNMKRPKWNEKQSIEPRDSIGPSWSWMCKGERVELTRGLQSTPILKLVSSDLNPMLKFHKTQRVNSLTVKGYLRKVRGRHKGANVESQWRKQNLSVDDLYLDDHEKRYLGTSWNEYNGTVALFNVDKAQVGQMDGKIDYYCLFVVVESQCINGLLLEGVDGSAEASSKRITSMLGRMKVRRDETPAPMVFKRAGIFNINDELLALKLRYQVRARYDATEERWTNLREQLRAERKDGNSANESTWIDIEVDPREVDPSELYAHDQGGDFTWLKRLEPQTITLI